MNEDEFKARTKRFAVDVVAFVASLPHDRQAEVMARQLLRSGTSVGANYRSATRAQSAAHMVSKLSIVEEEADESIYWLELIQECGLVHPDNESVKRLKREASQLVAMTVASKKTLRVRNRLSTDRKSKIDDRKLDSSP